MIRTLPAAAFFVLSAFAAGASPVGVWSLQEGKATVRIYDCGGSLCATIVALKKPNDRQGRPKVDRHNPDPAKRGRPVLGVSLLTGMTPTGAEWTGRLYNPDDGRTYAGRLAEDGGGALRLEGCLITGLICKTQTLTRLE